LWMGIYPSSFTSFFDASVASMVQHHTQAMAAPAATAVKLAGVLH
jgi:NADH-quinone oxidoreductase subunit M